MLPFLVYVEVGGGSQHQSALITSVRETKMDSLKEYTNIVLGE